ncbi:MAG: WG repeat-containing protein [Erysipelotrichales bacterium]|nr:WG repeat-containing protein [Erysipelotrichales bacterium]
MSKFITKETEIYKADPNDEYNDIFVGYKTGVILENFENRKEDDFIKDWWIEPRYDSISIVKLKSQFAFICYSYCNEKEENKNYTLILENKEVIITEAKNILKIADQDIFIIQEKESNKIIEFDKKGNFDIQETKYYEIYNLNKNVRDEIKNISNLSIKYIAIFKEKWEYEGQVNYSDKYIALDKDFKEISTLSSTIYNNLGIYRLSKKYTAKIIKLFFGESSYCLLLIENIGIITTKLYEDIEYLGLGDYFKIKHKKFKSCIINSFGQVYERNLEWEDIYKICYSSSGYDNIHFIKNGNLFEFNVSGQITAIKREADPKLKDVPENLLNCYKKMLYFTPSQLNAFNDSLKNKDNITYIVPPKEIDNNRYSCYSVGFGLYCLYDYEEDTSIVLNRKGEIVINKIKRRYLKFYEDLFLYQSNNDIFCVSDSNDNLIFSSENEVKIFEIPNFPIIGEKIDNYKENWKLFNFRGERIFKNIDQIQFVDYLNNGFIKLGKKGRPSDSLPKNFPYYDYDSEDRYKYVGNLLKCDYNTDKIIVWGLYNIGGKEILPQEYHQIEEEHIFNLLKISKLYLKYRRGYILFKGLADYCGNIILEPQYEYISILNDKYLKVNVNYYYGLLDYQFKSFLPCRYKFLEIIKQKDIYKVGENIGFVNLKLESSFYLTDKGIINPNGHIVTESEKARIILPKNKYLKSEFNNGIAIICEDLEKEKKYGIINWYGKIILPEKYKYITRIAENIYRCGLFYEGGGREFDLYYIAEEFEIKFIGSFDFLANPAENSIGVGILLEGSIDQYTYGIINKKGEYILDIGSSTLGKEINRYRSICLNGNRGFINVKTKKIVLIPGVDYIGPIYNNIASFCKEGTQDPHSNVIKGGKWGVLDKNGEILIEAYYDKIFLDKFGRIYFRKDSDKIGVLNRKNKIIIPNEYDFKGRKGSFLSEEKEESEDIIILGKEDSEYTGEYFFFDNNGNLLKSEEYNNYGGF